MNKAIILIGSCKKDLESGAVQALRDTWLKDCPIPHQFFFGGTAYAYKSDEMALDAPDGLWIDLTLKTREMMRWAAANSWESVFRCDVDTFADAQKLVRDFELRLEQDYYGSTLDLPRPPAQGGVDFDFCHGGPGMWLSRKAVEILAAAPIDPEREDHKLQDQWIGVSLLEAGIKPTHDRRFSMGESYGRHEPPVLASNNIISCHLSKQTGVYDKNWMYEAYRKAQPVTVASFKPQYEWIGDHGDKVVIPRNLPAPTSKVLIACNSCWKDIRNGSNAGIRATWATELPKGWDLRFFVGDRNFTPEEEKQLFTPDFIGSPGSLGSMAVETAKRPIIGEASELAADEIMLKDVPDGYLGLPWKTVESLRWALEQGYDYIFRIFTDTYVFPDRLFKSGFEGFDALSVVNFNCPPCPAHPQSNHSCPLGGDGYWTSRKASQAIIDEPIKHWGEDTHVGFALTNAGIPCARDTKFRYITGRDPVANRAALTIHLSSRYTKWEPKLMLEAHKQQTEARVHFPKWEGFCVSCGSAKMKHHPTGPRCGNCGKHV